MERKWWRDRYDQVMNRRDFLFTLGAVAASGATYAAREPISRPIPKGKGERVAAVGLGSWQAFDVEASGADFEQARGALARYRALGGRVVDTSPMYGRAEAALGALGVDDLFVATKIWTRGKAEGERQLASSFAKLKRERLDLVQVHNLLDADAHLATIAKAKAQGTVRYAGVTHYTASAHAELERFVARDEVDFVQVNYSLAEPEADRRLLDAAAAHGVAVLVNRPFAEGAMFAAVKGKPLPAVAQELGCSSAAQLFVKWILGHEAVTCVLAGTRKPQHVEENLAAATEPLPSAAQRKQIAQWFGA
jgi:diketogulonate reductase-like aldo/keto reductase